MCMQNKLDLNTHTFGLDKLPETEKHLRKFRTNSAGVTICSMYRGNDGSVFCFAYFCMCMWCACMYAQARLCECACTWRSETDIWTLLLPLFTLSLRQGTQVNPACSTDSLSETSILRTLESQMDCHTTSRLHGHRRVELRSLRLCSKYVTPRAVPPHPICL